MKLSFFTIKFLMLGLSFSFSQELTPQIEIFTLTSGFGNNDITRFRMDPLSEVYCSSIDEYYHDPNARNTIAIEEVTGNYNGLGVSPVYGLQICFNNDTDLDKYYLGLYRFSIQYFNYISGEWTSFVSFFIDYRDCRYGRFGGGCNSNDIIIKYDKNVQKAYWAYGIPSPNMILIEITQNEIINWWEANDCDTHCVEDFDPLIFPQLNDITISNQNHPVLTWSGPDPNYDLVISYQVYKMMFSGKYAGIFRLIASLNSNTYTYTDYSLDVSQNQIGELLQYKIVAVFQVKPAETSNIEKIRILYNQEKSNHTIINPNKFYLSQNFANPFNPSTKISYSIKEEGLVTLKVYDVLGKEVATLINENKPEGNYEVDFNASQLPSGMYIYKLQSGSFSDVKKMLLTK